MSTRTEITIASEVGLHARPAGAFVKRAAGYDSTITVSHGHRSADASSLLQVLKQLQLRLVIGQYAVAYHLPGERNGLTQAVQNWRRHWPETIPLPHPSPTNNRWLAQHPWFEREVVPVIQARVADALGNALAD